MSEEEDSGTGPSLKKSRNNEKDVPATSHNLFASSNDSRDTIVSGTKNTSKFEEFFTFESSVKDGLTAVCLECKKKKVPKIIKRTGGNTSGLKKHLKSIHFNCLKKNFPDDTPTNSKEKKISDLFSAVS